MLDGDLNLNPEQLEAVAALSGFNLIVPEGTSRKKGVARWTEYVTIEEASREDETSQKGAARTVFTLKAKVIPGPGTTGDNVGRSVNEFMRVNFGVLKGNVAAAGANEVKKELTMSAMALATMKQLIQAAGLDLSGGLTLEILDALFPKTGQSVLIGQHFSYVIANNESNKNPNGENNQGVSAIFAAPEGI